MPDAGTRTAQPLWSVLPAPARARYLRRAAVALLDELDVLSLRLAEETGWPRAQLELTELLPAAAGLRALADEGPRALADRRLTAYPWLLLGRSTRLVQAPVGVVGLRGPSASPFAEPLLETAAALLAGNAVYLDARAAAPRLRAILLRAGVPGELIELAAPDETVCRRVFDFARPGRRGTLLVLNSAERERVIEAAMWAAFGRHVAAAGRLIVTPGAAPGLVEELRSRAALLRVGPATDPDVDVTAPPRVVLVSADDPLFVDPPDEPVLAVVAAPDTETAIQLAALERSAPVSIWARDAQQGERVARRLPSPATWVGRHGIAPTAVSVRLARHVVPRQLEWRASWALATPRLPLDVDLVAAQRMLTTVRHGRESRRWPAVRAGAAALVRTAKGER